MTEKKIPSSISFGRTLLKTPSIEEMGVPAPLYAIAHLEPHVKSGDWVDRGQPLVTYKFRYFGTEEEPSLLMAWHHNKIIEHELVLRSPISGLVICNRSVDCRTSSPGHLAYYGLIDGYTQSLPMLLIPEQEPAWDDYELANIASSVRATIAHDWKRNVHNCGSPNRCKKKRLGGVSNTIFKDGTMAQFENQHLSEAVKWCPEYLKTYQKYKTVWETVDFDEFSNSEIDLKNTIEYYRAKDYQLRDKLAHLIHT